MSAIDDAMTAMCVARGVRERQDALGAMVVACLDELADRGIDGAGIKTCRDRADAFCHFLWLAVFRWEMERGLTSNAYDGPRAVWAGRRALADLVAVVRAMDADVIGSNPPTEQDYQQALERADAALAQWPAQEESHG